MLKFDFAVTTRDGQKIDSIVIAGKDRPDAERKLLQMYHHCQVVRCEVKHDWQRQAPMMSVEDILTLISK